MSQGEGDKVGVTIEEIARIHPVLYHMAEPESWPSIRKHGLLSTTALLDQFKIQDALRHQIEESRRATAFTISDETGKTAWIRDQKPLSDQRLVSCLQDGLCPAEWYRLLNGKVFFSLRLDRIRRLMGAYPGVRHLVIEVNTASLLACHAAAIRLAPINTGCTQPMAFPRGLATFLRPAEYPFAANRRKKGGLTKAIVELTVEYRVLDIADHTERVREAAMHNGELVFGKVLFARS